MSRDGRSVNGIFTLVHQANFSEGEFAKLVPLSPLSFSLFLFLFYYSRVGGLLSLFHLFFSNVKGCLGGG